MQLTEEDLKEGEAWVERLKQLDRIENEHNHHTRQSNRCDTVVRTNEEEYIIE